MKFLIIETHPYEGSLNREIGRKVKEALLNKHQVDTIDIVADNFDPVMKLEDLKLFSQGKYSDKLVGVYQNKIKEADYLIFIYPTWWVNVPANLKGFFDKVFLKNFAYEYTQDGERGMLNKKAAIISTMETDFKIYDEVFKNPIENQFIKGVLEFCGIKSDKYFLIDHVVTKDDEYRKEKINEIEEYFKEI